MAFAGLVSNRAGGTLVVEVEVDDGFADAADLFGLTVMVRAAGVEAYVFETVAGRWHWRARVASAVMRSVSGQVGEDSVMESRWQSRSRSS